MLVLFRQVRFPSLNIRPFFRPLSEFARSLSIKKGRRKVTTQPKIKLIKRIEAENFTSVADVVSLHMTPPFSAI